MSDVLDDLTHYWLWMLEPPWRHSGPNSARRLHWSLWLSGWVWALAGIFGGALVAPTLVQLAGLADTPYQDAFVIAVAVVAGFLVQILGGCIHLLARMLGGFVPPMAVPIADLPLVFGLLLLPFGCALLPLAGVVYSVYRYLTWLGAGQGLVTTALVGGMLIKTLLVPLSKGIVTGALFKLFMGWLRGGKAKSAKVGGP